MLMSLFGNLAIFDLSACINIAHGAKSHGFRSKSDYNKNEKLQAVTHSY